MIKLSKRMKNVAPSASLAIAAKAISLKEKGINVISLSVGEPDSPMPEEIKQEAISALNKGLTKYTKVEGITELKKAIVTKLQKDNSLSYNTDEITIGCGAKQVIFNAIMSFVGLGDEVIIPAPYWVSYPEMVNVAEGQCVFINTKIEDNFKITPAQLKKSITKKTKIFLFNSPSNPTGMVYSKEEIEAIGKVLKDKNILIIADEIYEKIIYEPNKHYSIASVCPFLKDQTLLINGMSKAYAMPGMRIGYGAAPKHIIAPINILQGHSTSNANSIAQYSSVIAFDKCQYFIDKMQKLFSERRDFVFNRINKIPGFKTPLPEGAFYFLPDISFYLKKHFKNDIEFSSFLLEKANVAVVPGSAFGAPKNIRLSYAVDIKVLDKALDSIDNAVKNL